MENIVQPRLPSFDFSPSWNPSWYVEVGPILTVHTHRPPRRLPVSASPNPFGLVHRCQPRPNLVSRVFDHHYRRRPPGLDSRSGLQPVAPRCSGDEGPEPTVGSEQDVVQVEVDQLVWRYAATLAVGPTVRIRALDLGRRAVAEGRVTGSPPSTVAAAALYLAAREAGLGLTQMHIAAVCGTTDTTIRAQARALVGDQ